MIVRREGSPIARTTAVFLGIAAVCLFFADISISTLDPWRDFARLLEGIVTPDFYSTESLGLALAYTLAFALLGVQSM